MSDRNPLTWSKPGDAARAAAPSVEPDCGAPSQGGPCVLPRGHNIGRADIPENHRAAAPPVEPGCPECGLVGAHNPRCASRWDVPPPDRVAGLREAAGRVLSWLGTCDQFDHHGNCQTHAIEKPCRVEALRAALLAEPVPGLDVERLARAIDDHGDNCSHMAIPECAGRIAAEYVRLSETPDAD